jgi:hypothetical protein
VSANRITVESTYTKAAKVPHIGQRKKMRVNGRTQTVILNSIKATRRAAWDDDKERHIFEFDATEEWGTYYDVQGM